MKHKIQQVRQEKGITQKELAEKMNITRQGVSSIENSDSVTLNTLVKVSKALGCYVHELIDDSPEAIEAQATEVVETITQSIEEQIESLLQEQDEYFEKQFQELLPKLNNEGKWLLIQIIRALCSTQSLLKEGEAIALDNGNEKEKEN